MIAIGNDATAVIEGHGFDRVALEGYVQKTLQLTGPLEVREFGGGYSNFTFLLTIGGRELVMRRGPAGVVIKGAHDMSREYKALVGLAPMWSKSPRPIAYCDDTTVIGAPFYLMERVDGVVLRRDSAGLGPEVMQRLSESLVDTLVEYHAVDYVKAGLGALGKPDGFLERQVAGWSERYRKAKTEELPDIDAMAVWLAANVPPAQAPTMLHNDFKYDNVLIVRQLERVVCVLDWEMATIGDPLVDLGAALALWQEAGDPPRLQAARFGPTHLPGNLTRSQFAARYAEKTGRDLTHLNWYYVLGLFRMLISLQQLYQRLVLGKTTEQRYLIMPEAVRGMAQSGVAVIGGGPI